MKIAVTYENGQVFQHFGHTEAFKVYETENNEIKSESIIPTLGNGHGALAGFLKLNNIVVHLNGQTETDVKNHARFLICVWFRRNLIRPRLPLRFRLQV